MINTQKPICGIEPQSPCRDGVALIGLQEGAKAKQLITLGREILLTLLHIDNLSHIKRT